MIRMLQSLGVKCTNGCNLPWNAFKKKKGWSNRWIEGWVDRYAKMQIQENINCRSWKVGIWMFVNNPICLKLLLEKLGEGNKGLEPWLVWLSGLSTGCKPKHHRFHSQSRHIHAWVVGQVPSRGHARGNHTLLFLSLSFSLPLSKKK